MYIFRGVAGVNTTLILAGSIPAAFLALMTDFGLGRMEKMLKNPQKPESQGLQPLHTLFSITLLDPLVNFPGITDRIILQVRTISDIAPYTPSWLAAFGYEFIERADGFEGLSETYDLKFAEPPRVMELGLTYRALAEQRVDILDFR